MTCNDQTIQDLSLCVQAGLRRTMRLVGQVYDDALRPAGLRATQFTVLSNIVLRGEMPISRLAEILVVDRTTLSRNLKPMVQKGWITLSAARDERVRVVVPTEAGIAKMQEALPLWRAAQNRVTERLGKQRITAMRDAHDHLQEMLKP